MSSIQQRWFDQVAGVLETLNQGVIINDAERRVVFANSMFLEMVKLRPHELLGRPITELFPPDDVPRLLEYIGRRETEGRAQYEFYIPQADGGRLPVAVTARQVQPVENSVFSIVTATDISALKRVEMELREANAQLIARQRQTEEELRLAERVQQSLTPKSLVWRGISVEAFYQAVWSIGGDYGLVNPGDDHLDVVVCDVAGHGISSALIANRIYSETMAQIERGSELSSMLRHLNRFSRNHLASSGSYFTMAAARFSGDHPSIQFAGAGHPPAMLVAPRESPRLLESKSMILGMLEDAVHPEAAIEEPVRPNDRLLIYTDGLTERFNSEGEMLGVDGLAQIAEETSTLPLAEMKEEILSRVSAWCGGPAADDISLVLVEIP